MKTLKKKLTRLRSKKKIGSITSKEVQLTLYKMEHAKIRCWNRTHK